MASIVLVHGAFQGGWVWEKTAAALTESGHAAHCPTMSGCGRQPPHAGAGLAAHIADVTRYITAEALEDVVLVGNSYSGLVCCGVAEQLPKAMAHLVLVDGILPLAGKSFADMGGEPFRQMLAPHVLEPASPGAEELVRPWPLAAFGVPPQSAQWFAERLQPFPLRAFTEAYPGAGRAPQARRTYIRCVPAANPMLAAMAARAEAEGFAMRDLPSGHCAPACVPLELAALLHEVIG